jgi:spermidine/putrescine transport system permease protein
MAGIATSGRRRSRVAPYAMAVPAIAYLAIFFVYPLWSLLRTSLSRNSGSVFLPTLEFDWAWSNYGDAFTDFRDQIGRSLVYAGLATLICLALAYPLAYVIAFKAGRWKNLLLGLVILPFFVTFLVRTLAWKTILADDGWVVSAFDAVGLLPREGRLLSTSWGVVGGLVYNFLPFMVLPLYVSLEKIDPRLMEAAGDLYSTSWRGFRKVIVPLSMPGVIAGSLLVFIPASGDFVNAQYLGGTQNTMIGNVIQKQFLVVKDYPAAAALSFVLMAIILAAVLAYTRALGTDDLV